MAETGSHESARQEPDDRGSPPEPWTAAKFLHRATVLRDHLLEWHKDDGDAPIQAVASLDAERFRRRTFRDCFTGDHGPRPKDVTVLASSRSDAKGGVVGEFSDDPKRLTNRDLTLWLLRDYWEHLLKGGESELFKYLKSVFEDVIDEVAYDVPQPCNEVEKALLTERAGKRAVGIVTGRPVRPELVYRLVAAAEKYLDAEALRTSPNDSPIYVTLEEVAKIASTPKKTLEYWKAKKSCLRRMFRTAVVARQDGCGTNFDRRSKN